MRVLAFATVATTLLSPLCVGALLVLEKRSQTSAICLPGYSWMDNSRDVPPCYLASVVEGSCGGIDYLVPPLDSNHHYTPPNSTTANLCTCSWATYNLLGACTLCQDFPQSLLTWPEWATNCGSNTSPGYFPSQIAVPEGTLLPWYAATDPTTWKAEGFNLNDAYAIASQGHSDVTVGTQTSTHQNKSTHVGAIVGGVIGGLAALIILGLALLLLYRRRLAGRPLKPTQIDPGHVKLPSDTSQITSGTSFGHGYQGANSSFVTSIGTALSPTTRSESDARSYFGSVAHSDTLYSSVPPPLRAVQLPSDDAEIRNPQDIVMPFVVPPNPAHGSREDRKRADRAAINVYPSPISVISHVAGAPAPNDDHSSRQPVGPPAYTARPGPTDFMSTGSQARTRPTHTKKGSTDTSFSVDSTQGGSPTTTSPGTHGIPGLDDVVEETGFDRPETMSGTGGTLATGMSTQLHGRQVFKPFVENSDQTPM